MTTTQTLTEGATITLAGRSFTVDTIYSSLVLLTSERGVGYVVNRLVDHPVRVHSLGSTLRKHGNPVRVLVDGDTITEVA